jgi:hypothetical protein
MAKLTMNGVTRPGEAHAATIESLAQALCFDSDDKAVRMDAFLAKGKSRGGSG